MKTLQITLALVGFAHLACATSNRLFQLGFQTSMHRTNALQRPHHERRTTYEVDEEAITGTSVPQVPHPGALGRGHQPETEHARGDPNSIAEPGSLYDSILSRGSDYKVRILNNSSTGSGSTATNTVRGATPQSNSDNTSTDPTQASITEKPPTPAHSRHLNRENSYETQQEGVTETLNEIVKGLEVVIPTLTRIHYRVKDLLASQHHSQLRQSEPLTEESVLPMPTSGYSRPSPPPTPTSSTPPLDLAPLVDLPVNRTAVDDLLKRAYPSQQLSYAIGLVRMLPEHSQAFGYERLAELIIANERLGHAEQDLLKLTCELRSRRLTHLLQRHDLYNSYIFPVFFGSKKEISLVAKTTKGKFEHLYFDYASMSFGIADEAAGRVTSRLNIWTFVPLPDTCYFLLQQATANYIVGMATESGDETTYSRRVYLTVDQRETEERSSRFHWKVSLFKPDAEQSRPIILLENRETGLAIQWDENGSVFPNAPAFSTNQMWYQGQVEDR